MRWGWCPQGWHDTAPIESLHRSFWTSLHCFTLLFPWHQHCSAREECSPVTQPHRDRGVKKPVDSGMDVTLEGTGTPEQSDSQIWWWEQRIHALLLAHSWHKISIHHTLPGMAATSILAAFLHVSSGRGQLCARMTFKSEEQEENTWEALNCSRLEDVGETLPTECLAGFMPSFPDIQTQPVSLLASEGKHYLVY